MTLSYTSGTLLSLLAAYLIQNGVAHAQNVHQQRVVQQRQQVVGHALPEVQQEVVYLEEHREKDTWASPDRSVSRAYQAETSPRQSWHWWRCPRCTDSASCTSWSACPPIILIWIIMMSHKGSNKCWVPPLPPLIQNLFPGDVSLQNKVLGAGEFREQRSRFGAKRVFPGEASLHTICPSASFSNIQTFPKEDTTSFFILLPENLPRGKRKIIQAQNLNVNCCVWHRMLSFWSLRVSSTWSNLSQSRRNDSKRCSLWCRCRSNDTCYVTPVTKNNSVKTRIEKYDGLKVVLT